jgi:hypothetical protein
MNFSEPLKALTTIEAGSEVEWIRSENRRKIQDLFNGVPPLAADDAKRTNLKINVNWGEASVLAHHARRQYFNAFIKPKRYFRISLPFCREEQSQDWAWFMTKTMNRTLKHSRCYTELWRYRIASIVSHGIGPQIWDNGHDWLPRFVALDNLRIATDTRTSLDNLEWFAERKEYTPGELAEKVFGKKPLPGWNQKAVRDILKAYHDTNYEEVEYDWSDRPEKMAELYKQNGHFYSGDSVPSINLWHLYWIDRRDGERKGWKMGVLLDRHARGFKRDAVEWLFNSKRIVADELPELLHIQFGDLSSKAPFLYHSVRSLGFMLMEPCFYTNLMRCRLLQHVFENFNTFFRTADPAGKARAQKIELFDRVVLHEGLGIVPRNERHQIEPNLVNTTMSQLKQLMGEASASYTQQTDTGTQKEQTAYETAVKASLVNAMLSGLIANAFDQEQHAYEEIARRFCREDTRNADAERFQRDCTRYGIPRKYVDPEQWEITPEVPIGAGNPVNEQSQIKELMGVRPMLNPTAQQDVLHRFVSIMTDNANEAERLVPLDGQQGVSNARKDAEYSYPLLMRGLPVSVREELNLPDQINTYLGLFAGDIAIAHANGGVDDWQTITGFQNVSQHIQKLVQLLEMDETAAGAVKEYMDDLGKLNNEVTGFAQRLQEQEQAEEAQQGMDPKVTAEIAQDNAKFQSQQSIRAMEADAEEERKTMAFANEQARKDAAAHAEIMRKQAQQQDAEMQGSGFLPEKKASKKDAKKPAK